MLQVNFKNASRILQKFFKNASRMLQEGFKKASRRLQECFKMASRRLQDDDGALVVDEDEDTDRYELVVFRRSTSAISTKGLFSSS